ncbi:hypothetical protein Cs7R123_40720 [Catellatospora sp. TT07R-123]|uniref:DUF6457 domain-containing protein n=1 Tax=Catellatospora sp. TT07R-123 TaxID=2733863 RepID=UPI001B1EE4E1|nr:DUF6457 domain-containing protein [Catellatospora sp. TT07R-123]GHJ46730.1 hypothetical protein Cs7R123_40720 [Catellatospora sp. TT07R-123]
MAVDLTDFTAAACAELGLPTDAVDTAMVLDLAREVAHNTVRPGAPVSTFLLGLAVGRGGDADELAARLVALAQRLGQSNP